MGLIVKSVLVIQITSATTTENVKEQAQEREMVSALAIRDTKEKIVLSAPLDTMSLTETIRSYYAQAVTEPARELAQVEVQRIAKIAV